MKIQSKNQIWLVLGFIIGVFTLLLSVESSAAKNPGKTTASVNTQLYLPVSVKNYPWVTTFGAQVINLDNTNIAGLAQDSGIYWARMDAFDWARIEPVKTNPRTYNWDVVNEEALKAANANEINVIAIIRNSPSWAQKKPPYLCGPINQTNFPDFAEFLRELVKKYGVQPYNIRYWELWNEPDLDPTQVPFDNVFGCWGDLDDRYFGGRYYAEMLKVAYPAIKVADPMAKVLLGGLLLDCDPSETSSCKTGKFLEGVLRNGGGNYFDILNFHGYAPYTSPSSGYRSLYLDDNFPNWNHRGGVVLGKIDFLQFMLAQFGIDKPIFHTEGSLICARSNTIDCYPPDNAFYEAQADYVVWLYIRNWANGIKATIWYEFEGPGWLYSGLLDGVQSPKPAYNALAFLTQELGTATYNGRVMENTTVAGYEFSTGPKMIWVLWSPDEKPHIVALPSTATKAFDKYGNEITLTGNQITVDSPVYVEFPR